MPPIIKQTIKAKQVSFWGLLITIVLSLLAINIMMRVLNNIDPKVASLGAPLAFVGIVTICFFVIYKRLAHYNYSLIEDELFMERVFSRSNHLFVSLKLSELKSFESYGDYEKRDKKNTSKQYKFVSGDNKQNWYVGEFTRSGDLYRFIIEPNEELLNAILAKF